MTSKVSVGDYLLDRRYKIVRALGSGGMASVFVAHDSGLNSEVAIKMMDPQLAATPDGKEGFNGEARRLSKLRHPNLGQYLNHFEDKGRLFLVTTLHNGRSYDKIIEQDGPLGEVRAVQVMIQILAGLSHAHARNILHRDIKPHNIMDDGDPVLIDLGIGKDGSPGKAMHTMVMSSGAFTPFIAPPEQATGMPTDVTSDLYSVGVTIYYLACGLQAVQKVMQQNPGERFYNPDPVFVGVSPALNAILQKATAKMPVQRYQSAQEFSEALTQLLGGAASASFSPSPPVSPSQPPDPNQPGIGNTLLTGYKTTTTVPKPGNVMRKRTP